MKIDKQKLQKQIKEGRSSHDVAIYYKIAPSTIKKKSKQYKKYI